jgi:hypothetical protein
MSSQRSGTASRLRRQAGPAIFDCKSGDLLSPESRLRFREKIGWVEAHDDACGGHYDTWKVEILHDDYQGSFNKDTVFRNSILLRVRTHFVSMLYPTNES